MNATNRAANRLFLLVSGLVLLAAGGIGLAVAFVPPVRAGWRSGAEQASAAIDAYLETPRIGDPGVAWIQVGAVAALALLVVLIVVMLLRLGGGRARSILDAPSALGPVVFAPDVAAGSLVPALQSSPEVASAAVRAYDVRRRPTLFVHLTLRRGASAREAVDLADDRLEAFEALLGEERTTLVLLSGGYRAARVAR